MNLNVFSLILLVFFISKCEAKIENSSDWPNAPRALDDSETKRAFFYLDKVWSNIDKIKNGEVLLSEQISVNTDKHASTYHLHFDYPNKMIRFDQVKKSWGKTTQLISTPGEVLIHCPNDFGSPTNIKKYPDLKSLPKIDGLKPIDARCAGLTTVTGFQKRFEVEQYKFLYDIDSLSYVSEQDGYVDLVWVAYLSPSDNKNVYKRLLRLDVNNGFTPILSGSIRGNLDDGFTTHSLCSAVWKKNADIWIPTNWRIEHRGARVTTRHNITLQWNLINEVPAPFVYSIEAFDAPLGTKIINNRIEGEKIIEGMIGGVPQIIGKEKPKSLWSAQLIIVLSVFFAGILILYILLQTNILKINN